MGQLRKHRLGENVQEVIFLDELDAEIIKILCKDARTPFKRIASVLGVGTDTIFRRFKKLQQDGVVLGSTIILSSRACGVQGLCGIFIDLKSGASVEKIRNELTKISHISGFVQLWGEFDFYVQIYFKNFQEVITLIDDIRKIEEVTSLDTMIYNCQEWSLPYIHTFEMGIPAWISNSDNPGRTITH